jgi:hypothetical protein
MATSIGSPDVDGLTRVALEWGAAGARSLVEGTPDDVIVVVDVLSFSTSVVLACEKGATVWPHPGPSATPGSMYHRGPAPADLHRPASDEA